MFKMIKVITNTLYTSLYMFFPIPIYAYASSLLNLANSGIIEQELFTKLPNM